MRLTDEQVREIEARAGKATKGPWEAKRIDHAPKRVEHYVDLRNEDDLFHEASGITYNRYVLPTDEQALHDVEFVAHARTDIPTLLADREALLAERDTWIETARQHHKNEEYYRGLVVRIGEAIGPQSYVSDDGSIQMDVLCAKVPELVEARLAEHDGLQTRMAEGFAAREGQVENGAKMIAELRVENAKLRRVVEADFKLFHAKEYGTLNEHQQALRMRADALADLEPPNVPDAKND